ncbi:MAG: helix-turn-helix domain-containing protein [Candidatus Obscuribacterales bacterium]|nr:helix-turn-helix domain-containing protein [Candidatus Obscuribacterales bacterium]
MARKLIAEEKSFREIRKTREYSQVTLAEILGMGQGDLSKFERRTDANLSTIRRYIEAMVGLNFSVRSVSVQKPLNTKPVFLVQTRCLAASLWT